MSKSGRLKRRLAWEKIEAKHNAAVREPSGLWLIRKRGYVPPGDQTKPAAAAHIWTGEDTACRLYSTSPIWKGSRRKRYEVVADRGEHRICHMCQAVANRPKPGKNAELQGYLFAKVIEQLTPPR